MTRVVINFPYSGYGKGTSREDLFWKIIQTCTSASVGAERIIVVIDEDTVARGGAEVFLADAQVKQHALYVHRTWSVDTCQRWLAGWAVALGKLPCTGVTGNQALMLDPPGDNDHIALLPGDIDAVANHTEFFGSRLPVFLAMDSTDIVVGDFETGERLASKDLIDLHGTYPLFALWFPEIAVAAREKSIWKPRSEFVNIRAHVLRELLLEQRKFAYEQTLNMLIHSWRDFATPASKEADAGATAAAEARDSQLSPWRYSILVHSLGAFADDPYARNISGAIDQIERTERMLKMVWREHEFSKATAKAEKKAREKTRKEAEELASRGEPDERYEAYEKERRRILREESARILRQYDRLEATSRAIEAAARVTVLSFIAPR